MKINFTGKHLTITPAIKSYATEKFEKLSQRDKDIRHVDAIFSVEHGTHIAEALVRTSVDLHAKAESSDLYAAIDELENKLLMQLTKRKEKKTEHA